MKKYCIAGFGGELIASFTISSQDGGPASSWDYFDDTDERSEPLLFNSKTRAQNFLSYICDGNRFEVKEYHKPQTEQEVTIMLTKDELELAIKYLKQLPIDDDATLKLLEQIKEIKALKLLEQIKKIKLED